jgi:putative isomerase
MKLTDSVLEARLSPRLALGFSHWQTGNLIAFSHLDGPTDYDDGLVARTVDRGLHILLPGTGQLRFDLDIHEARITSDFFEARSRNGVTLRGALLDAHHLLLEGPCQLHATSASIAFRALGDRLLIGSTTHFRPSLIDSHIDEAIQARLHWQTHLTPPAGTVSLSATAQRTFARALSQMKGQVCSPEGILKHPWSTPDRWPHRAMWLWDSAFHAIGWRHIDPALAKAMIDAVLDAQAPDGFIPHTAEPRGHSLITQPPILAFAAELVLEKNDDPDWLARIYPRLCAYVNWDATHRDNDGGGLLEWFIEEARHCRSGESGMDNSPRFDLAIPLDAPDFNAFLANEYEVLSRFARRLQKTDDAVHWFVRHNDLCHRINQKLWSTEHRLYCDRDPATDTLSPVLSSAGFLPLLCGAPDPEQAAALAAHLTNPSTFGTPLPIPSIAANSKLYSKDMWRGPVWINVNWLVARGLQRYGLHQAADRLRKLSLGEIERTCTRYGTFFEYFDDRLEVEPPSLLRKSKNIPGQHPYQVIHDYGWSATLYVDWLLSR